MTQRELNRAVARATGESVAEIAHLGFGPLSPTSGECEPLVMDWDEYDLHRNVALCEPRRPRRAVA